MNTVSRMNYYLESNMNTRTQGKFIIGKKKKQKKKIECSAINSDGHVPVIASELITFMPLEIKLMFISRIN